MRKRWSGMNRIYKRETLGTKKRERHPENWIRERNVIMNFRVTEEERQNYYPISIYCPICRKDSTTITNYNEETGEVTSLQQSY